MKLKWQAFVRHVIQKNGIHIEVKKGKLAGLVSYLPWQIDEVKRTDGSHHGRKN